jgi:hypothetical protein
MINNNKTPVETFLEAFGNDMEAFGNVFGTNLKIKY